MLALLPRTLANIDTYGGVYIYMCEYYSMHSCYDNLSGGIGIVFISYYSLRRIYANGNRISSVPEDLCRLDRLEVVNLANNALASLPPAWLARWGAPQPPPLSCLGGGAVVLTGNPLCSSSSMREGSAGVVVMDVC
jgi:hypothetical protein